MHRGAPSAAAPWLLMAATLALAALVLLPSPAAAAPSPAAANATLASSSKQHPYPKKTCPKTVAVDPIAARAPLADAGEKCGPYLAICKPGLCCSQSGFCGDDAFSCGALCQCSFSGGGGANSRCRGQYPPPFPKQLPIAAGNGSPCGAYVARCPKTYCCTEQSVCAPSNNALCLSAGCQSGASPLDGGACAAAVASRPSRVFEKTLVLDWTTAAPDGTSRKWIAINGQFPAENLRVDVGDRLLLTVVNRLRVATALHAHGFVQRRTAPSDGVATVTQRPIAPGESFVYNFVADAPGTYWMHAHQKSQEMDGLRFGVAVADPAEKSAGRGPAPPTYYSKGVANVQVDEIVTLADLYHQNSDALTQWYLSPASQGNEPVPQAAMIDGVAQTPGCADDNSCTYRRVLAGPSPVLCPSEGTESGASAFPTLLRVVNMAGMAVFRFSVDGHRLRVVGADSTPIDSPQLLRSVVINAAQRYDLLLCREEGSSPIAPAWIRAEMVAGIFYKEPERPLVLGVLVYGANDDSSTSLPSEPILPQPTMTPTLSPLVPEVLPSVLNPQRLLPAGGGVALMPQKATKTLRLVLNFEEMRQRTQYAVFNNVSFTFTPSSPSLMERYLGTPPGPPPKPDGFRGKAVYGFNVLDVKTGDVVDLIIDNLDTGEHPIHLHGVDGFWVVRYGMANEGNFAPGKGAAGRVARDTETVNLKSFLQVRYVAANPGSLFIAHCHIGFHLSAGLAFVVRTT
jgi:FtsP/CotA-like multicopper oxidase with cupredoxin domain